MATTDPSRAGTSIIKDHRPSAWIKLATEKHKWLRAQVWHTKCVISGIPNWRYILLIVVDYECPYLVDCPIIKSRKDKYNDWILYNNSVYNFSSHAVIHIKPIGEVADSEVEQLIDGSDYLDLDLVDLNREDYNDIVTILKLNDVLRDKLAFTVS